MTSKSQPVTQALLARGHSPDSAARIFTDKIERRPLYLRAQSPQPTNRRTARRLAREQAKAKKKQRPKPLSARERRRRGLYEVPRSGQKYEVVAPLHALWLGYIREILGDELHAGGQSAGAKLASADFHGAEVEVSRSGCVSRVGLKGIVIKDSKFVFEIVTRKNQVKVVPKEGTVFRIEVSPSEESQDGQAQGQAEGQSKSTPASRPLRPFVFEVLGDQFLLRSADRASRKFKAHFLKNI